MTITNSVAIQKQLLRRYIEMGGCGEDGKEARSLSGNAKSGLDKGDVTKTLPREQNLGWIPKKSIIEVSNIFKKQN